MKLVVDIGNTNIVIGVFKNNWKHIWRLETKKNTTIYEYSFKLNNLFLENNIDSHHFKYKVLSSVVPDLTDVFLDLLTKIGNSKTVLLNKNIYNKLVLNIPNPNEIGTDLVANALAQYKQYQTDMIIIDFGTALTFTVVDKNANILGVNIAPGIKTSIDALGDKASQLDTVPLQFPEKPLGSNTIEAIQNGVLIGYIGLVSHMITTIKNEVGQQYKVIATGGLSFVLKPYLPMIDYFDKNLTLTGLLIAGQQVLNENK